LPSFWASTRRSLNSRGKRNRTTADRERALLEIDDQLADLEHWPARRPGAPKNGAQPREQLLDSERLLDVVVRARIERRDLLRFVPTTESTRTGAELQVRSFPADPVPSGPVAPGRE
jgi:hypothetical protein